MCGRGIITDIVIGNGKEVNILNIHKVVYYSLIFRILCQGVNEGFRTKMYMRCHMSAEYVDTSIPESSHNNFLKVPNRIKNK